MRWARTLMLAQMLTKAIQANVAHEAGAATQRPNKESAMGDDAPNPNPNDPDPQSTDAPAAIEDAPPAPAEAAGAVSEPQTQTPSQDAIGGGGTAAQPQAAQPQAPQPQAPEDNPTIDMSPQQAVSTPTGGTSSIDTTLQNAANLAQALNQNPQVLAFMNALVGNANAKR